MSEQEKIVDHTQRAYLKTEYEHDAVVRQKKKPAPEILDQITGLKADLIQMALGVAGEAGELVDVIKKHGIYDQPLDVDNVIEELGDLEFYMKGIRQALYTNRAVVLAANTAKLNRRYKDKYSDAEAKERADKSEDASKKLLSVDPRTAPDDSPMDVIDRLENTLKLKDGQIGSQARAIVQLEKRNDDLSKECESLRAEIIQKRGLQRQLEDTQKMLELIRERYAGMREAISLAKVSMLKGLEEDTEESTLTHDDLTQDFHPPAAS